MKLRIALLCLLPLGAFAQREDAQLIGTLKSELEYSFKELKKQDAAPYYMSFRVNGLYNATLTSSFGASAGCNETRGRTFVPQIRLGSPDLDNFKYTSQGGRMTRTGQVEQGVMLPLDNGNADALKEAIWRGVLSRYDYAVEVWGQTRSQANVSVADEDKAGCFSEAPAEKYYEERGMAGAAGRDFRRVQVHARTAAGDGVPDFREQPHLVREHRRL